MMRHEKDELRAIAQADRLVDYWREQGFDVTAWVEKVMVPRSGISNAAGAHWVVRSDMVNGHPVKRSKAS